MDILISQAIIGELIVSGGFLNQSIKEKKNKNKKIGAVMRNRILKYYEHKYKEYFLHKTTDIILLKIRQIKKTHLFKTSYLIPYLHYTRDIFLSITLFSKIYLHLISVRATTAFVIHIFYVSCFHAI